MWGTAGASQLPMGGGMATDALHASYTIHSYTTYVSSPLQHDYLAGSAVAPA
jgi:hypothetical protein